MSNEIQGYSNRTLMLSENVDNNSVGALIQKIVGYNVYDDFMESQLQTY